MELHKQVGIPSGTIMAIALLVGVASWAPVLVAQSEEAVIRTIEPSRDWLGGIPEAPTEDWEVAFGGFRK